MQRIPFIYIPHIRSRAELDFREFHAFQLVL